MKKKHELTTRQCAMYALLAVQEAYKRDPAFLMSDVAKALQGQYGMCRATAFRYMRTAVDVLCIAYDTSEARRLKIADRMEEGWGDARAYGYPNGKPGRPRMAA